MLDKNSIEDKKVIRRIQSGETEDSQILIEKILSGNFPVFLLHDRK